MTIVPILILVAFVFLMYMLFRNMAVYNYRSHCSKIVFSADIYDYKWRLAVMDSVDYDRMMLRFWIWPLSRFYPDLSFLDLTIHRDEKPESIKQLESQIEAINVTRALRIPERG